MQDTIAVRKGTGVQNDRQFTLQKIFSSANLSASCRISITYNRKKHSGNIMCIMIPLTGGFTANHWSYAVLHKHCCCSH